MRACGLSLCLFFPLDVATSLNSLQLLAQCQARTRFIKLDRICPLESPSVSMIRRKVLWIHHGDLLNFPSLCVFILCKKIGFVKKKYAMNY